MNNTLYDLVTRAYQHACAIRELCVQAVNAASQAQRAIDELTGEV